MTRDRWGPILLGLSLLAGRTPCLIASDASRTVTVLSEPYTIDRKYESMEGPESQQPVVLLETAQPELLWIRGGRVELVGPDGQTPRSGEFLCHSSLRLDAKQMSSAAHNEQFCESPKMLQRLGKLLSFVQGHMTDEFPEGFGMPVLSTEPLILWRAFLNQNAVEPVQLRTKWTIEFVRERDLQQPMKPLFPRALAIYVPAEDGTRRYHWRMGPGREVRRSRVTEMADLPYDTTVHYIRAHLHAFGESVALRDVTTDTTLFTSHATPYPDRLGIAQMDVFSSEAGLPVYQDHEYELVSVYHNTSGSEQVGMAGLTLHLLGTRFQKPTQVSQEPLNAQGGAVPLQ